MNIFPFSQLEKLISEYEKDSRIIKSNSLIMENYPKVFLMYVASTYERQIKRYFSSYFLSCTGKSNTPIDISKLISKQPQKPLEDKLFALFKGYRDSRNGGEVLCANSFFQVFTGLDLEQRNRNDFAVLRQNQLNLISPLIQKYETLSHNDDDVLEKYVKLDDVRVIWSLCTFEQSRDSYLGLKLRRNIIAHDYMRGLSDTFSDLQKLYYSSLLFVMSLEITMQSIS